MQRVLLNVDDSILTRVMEVLSLFPKDKLEIIDNLSFKMDLVEFRTDLRNAMIEIKQMECGKKATKSWQEVRNEL